MEWKVDWSRHKLHRPPSSCRRFPIQQARCRERDFWGTLTILSLFAEIVMANSETLRAASGSLGSVNSASMENNSMETPFLATWNHQHGKNVAMQDLNTSELLRTAHSPSHSRNAKRNPRRSGRGTCRLHSRALNVQDLGLGYKTEEVVLFKYCSGSCESSITNYDQILNYIMQKGLVPAEKDFVSKPCCRPLRFENFSFLDIYNVWQNVEKGSAAACGCVG